MTVLAPAPPSSVQREVRRSFHIRRRRYLLFTTILIAVVVVVGLASLCFGDYKATPWQVLQALFGGGESSTRFIVQELRLPRLTLALLVGTGFAVAGALFQSVLRNPLASPDIIGVSQGASAAAVLALLVLDLPDAAVPAFALIGALIVGAALYAISWKGGLTGFRFVLSGIGVSYLATSLIGYLLSRADVREAQTALTWLTGSVGSAQWDTIRLLAIALAVLLPLVALIAPQLRMLLLGDETSAALGIRPERIRLAVIGLGICLAAAATAAAGPLPFVALAAAPIARRVLADGTLALIPCALTGAILVSVSDFAAQHLIPVDLEAPAGVVTGVIGGPYLIWLLATSRRGGKVA